jgi:hypothetical protein
MGMLRLLGRGLLAVAVTVPLVACDSARIADPPVDEDISITGSSPAMEGTDPEEPRSGGDDGVSITLPGLPVGLADYDTSQEPHCVSVFWTGPPSIPPGVSVVVTKVGLIPETDVFEVDGSSCGEKPECAESFTFTSEPTSTSEPMSCSVSVRAVASNGQEARLKLWGDPRCPSEHAQWCRDLAASSGQTIPLTQPASPSTSEESSSQPPLSDESETPTTTS